MARSMRVQIRITFVPSRYDQSGAYLDNKWATSKQRQHCPVDLDYCWRLTAYGSSQTPFHQIASQCSVYARCLQSREVRHDWLYSFLLLTMLTACPWIGLVVTFDECFDSEALLNVSKRGRERDEYETHHGVEREFNGRRVQQCC